MIKIYETYIIIKIFNSFFKYYDVWAIQFCPAAKKKCRLHWVIALERSLGAQYCIKGVYLFKHRKLQSISHRRIKFVDNYMELRLNFPFQQLSFRSESILSVKIQDGRHFFTKTENSLQAVHSCALSKWQNLQT